MSDTAALDDVSVGKLVGQHLYVHESALPSLPVPLQETIAEAVQLARLETGKDFNVIRLHELRDELSLLLYPDFFDDPFPALARSWRVSLSRQSIIFRTYEESRNPPILHRKELLLPKEDARAREYAALTEAAEGIGLFSEPNRIGFREHWYSLIAERGYKLDGNQFIPIANTDEADVAQLDIEPAVGIRRHLTALARSNYSAPVQALSRHGLINSGTTFFDYGCGRGDDVRGLIASGIDATGWDPHYAPDAEKRVADAVNIGFVINVIESLTERVDALKGAYNHTRGVLSVAAMLSSEAQPEGRPYGDGYLSSRNTFQKYFTQAQLRDFIEHTLDENAIAAGPGVFFIFRDKELEQRFLSQRYGHRVPTMLARGWIHERPRREPRVRVDRASQLYEGNRAVFDSLRLRVLELGRPPDGEDLAGGLASEIKEKIGSIGKALRIAQDRWDETEINLARSGRTSDLLVFLGLQQFQKRKPYRHLEPTLQRDIRYFFGDYSSAQASARQTLFSIGNLEAIDQACRTASEKGFGWLEEGQSLQLHASLLERLPTLLRVYVECATVLCGDISEFDLIKIHIRSGKVTLLKFDNFVNSPLPRLIQRVKVKLRDQDLDVFSYGGEYPSTLLYKKSRFINEEFPRYAEQLEFEESLDSLGLHDLSGFGPPEAAFHRDLEAARWQVDGFKIVRSRRIPGLDERCGGYFTYRQLIECGETQQRLGISNLPKEVDTYNALHDLATKVLDPVIEYFGMVKLTYGFCSRDLAKQIPARIAPELDQHAAHEKNMRGRPICTRLGAAVDFLVEHENMFEVAEWVAANTPFDRLYYYGPERPLHVSYSGHPAREAFHLKELVDGNRVPLRMILASTRPAMPRPRD
jgi:DNA phosphorothioation-associated putative methyltransferase